MILASYQYVIELGTDKHSTAYGVSIPLPHPPALEENISEATLQVEGKIRNLSWIKDQRTKKQENKGTAKNL